MIVHPKSKSVLLRVRTPETIRRIVAQSRDVEIHGHNLQVRHGIEETRVLRNLGIRVPPPIYYHYQWTGRHEEVWRHQKMTAAFMTLFPRGFILNQQGTAKTACVLWAWDYMINEGLAKRLLVVAPLSTLNHVWQAEAFATVPHRSCAVLYGSAAQRRKWLSYASDLYIINHDGLEIIANEIIGRMDITGLLVDESADYRNGQTVKWRVLNKIIRNRPDMSVWLMSGMPYPQAPTDAYPQVKLLFPERVPRFFGAFRREVMWQVSPYKWKPRKGAIERVHQLMQPAIRFKKADCLDLPPLVQTEREAQLTDEQKKEYERMRKTMQALADGSAINAVNAADQIGKLRQILLGAIKNPITGEYKELDYTPRFNLLMELILQADAKVIVVVPFKGILRFLTDRINKAGISCELINGDVPKRERDKIITRFKTTPDPHVLAIHPKVAAHGLNLTEADTTILYGPIYSNDQFQQVIERFNRPGQTRKMTLVRMGGHRLEWSIYKDVDERQNAQMSVLDLYRNEVLGL